MKLVVDVHYEGDGAYVSGVGFDSWQDHDPCAVYNSPVVEVQSYEPGDFYKREMPLEFSNKNVLRTTTVVALGK